MSSSSSHPDLILTNARITSMSSSPLPSNSDAIAVTHGRVSSIGPTSAIATLAGPSTKRIDARGRSVVPGLVDAHNHGVKACLARLYACSFTFSASPQDIEAALEGFFERNSGVECVMGGRYGSEFFKTYAGQLLPTPREWLDARSRGRAVYLREESGHNGWANSRALELVGITRESVDPKGGRIGRTDAGELTGVLIEDADVQARLRWPDWTAAQYEDAVREYVKVANGFGIVGSTDADANEGILKALSEVDREGGLSLHVVAAQTTPYGHREEPLDYGLHERWRELYTSDHVDASFVKIYLDGVARDDSRTAFLLEQYLPDPRFPESHRSHAHVPAETLARDYVELDRRGFTVKTHCCGDGSVRATLDAIQAAREANPARSEIELLRHEVAHCMLVSASDIPRFRRLNAVAELSPYLWSGESCVSHRRACLGSERVERWYPVKELLDAGTELAAGSDWPAAVASVNPWPGLASLVTRTDTSDPSSAPIGLDQAVSIEDALRIFTVQGARAIKRGKDTGSIEVGKSADFVVLDRDVMEVDPRMVGATKVDVTVFEGRIVYEREGAN
ncbi:amidohydrolase 3 [Gonapodya prolifera JEL478]|uniref:Amidohydrolase 3 n=1 Tax=Gonapodya prolifera (strain JEL478) TaxID=1344416 RepID=A0A139AG00_GONPJ|nr:amidohydrolase 3 [Gonapodya prolifera JEL478]|eukprot:KXS15629.1 amidohydrolase 3 [Gonapodya prolifera JEL478]